jgi:hypothetical protein
MSSEHQAAGPGKWTLSVVIVVVAAAAVAALIGCADLSRGDGPPDAGTLMGDADDAGAMDGPPVSFATVVRPLLLAGCQRCHAPGQPAGDTQLRFSADATTDYATVLPFVDTGAPASSRLLAKMSGHGHGGGVIYAEDTPEYATVLRWIERGVLP